MTGNFICLDCGCIFSKPKRFTEKHGLDSPPYEVTRGCPNCSGVYVDAVNCDCCREIITGEYVKTEDGNLYCENCCAIMDIEDCC